MDRHFLYIWTPYMTDQMYPTIINERPNCKTPKQKCFWSNPLTDLIEASIVPEPGTIKFKTKTVLACFYST